MEKGSLKFQVLQQCIEKAVKETTKYEIKKEMGGAEERKKEQFLNANDLLTSRVFSPQVVCQEQL